MEILENIVQINNQHVPWNAAVIIVSHPPKISLQ